ncbi:MAG: TetR/AcrR family transcriptional regulator [Flavobacteriales bacterium]|nr:TetR/AcrR family transcriptional regulator [Flavobacteriales bacterium]
MARDTKEQIISKATQVFNQRGYDAVTLHELAAELDMSRGNLAYHYKDKDLLLEAIVAEMWERIEEDRRKYRPFPSFENLHNEVQLYYKYQQEYAFLFLNPLLVGHPAVCERFREMTRKTIADNEASLAFAIKNGTLKPEPVPGLYHNIAFITWMLAFYWLSQQLIRGERTREDGEKVIWSQLIPHLTAKGLKDFKAFFGEDYFNNLGEPLRMETAHNFTF